MIWIVLFQILWSIINDDISDWQVLHKMQVQLKNQVKDNSIG